MIKPAGPSRRKRRMAEGSLVDQLFAVLEDLVIENEVLLAALRTAKDRLSAPDARELDDYIQRAMRDPELHAAVERDVARLREQPLGVTLAQLRRERVGKKK